MAVFPDRIVQKNSTETISAVTAAIDPVIGSEPVIGGELVVARAVGSAQLLTLDANNNPVVVGVSSGDSATTPYIKLNFEEDNTDTTYEYVNDGVPFSTAGKFGNCFNHQASSVAPRINPLRVLAEDSPVLGTSAWTLNFWFKADFDTDFYTAPSGEPQNSLIVMSLKDYLNGPGAFTITIDGGTVDTGGTGTDTSRTQDLAKGSIVFGLGGQFGATESTNSLIPSTGEVVTSANTSVCDDDWHYVTFMHEGGGIYSCFIDGVLKERSFIGEPINHNLPGTSGIIQPSGFEFGGVLTLNDNNAFPGVEHYGMNYFMDGVSMYAGNAIYRGLRSFDVPTTPPNDDAIQQPLDSLRTLLDTSIDVQPANGDSLVYNATEGAWENAPAPAFSLTGNNLGDIGDVTITGTASIAQGESLIWDTASSNWINSPILVENLDIDTTSLSSGWVIRYTGTNWKADQLQYTDITGRPTGLDDLTQNLDLSNYSLLDLEDVATSSLTQGDVLVWNASLSQFENSAQPPANIASNTLDELSDVKSFTEAYESISEENIWLHWNHTDQKWEPHELDYSEVTNTPVWLSQFYNNLNVSSFPNDANYISIADLNSESIDVFGDVDITSPVDGNVLVYRSGEWKNEMGTPANISNSSLGDLLDVTRTQSATTLPATVIMEDLGHLVFDSPLQATNITYQVMYDHDRQGVGLSAIRGSDQTGSEVFVSRGGGVDLRSDTNFFRLRGKPDVTTNRPELRWETGDSFATPATGFFISLKMPDTVLEDQTYYLPQEDGDVGDVLATNGSGELSWVARVSNNNLGALTDVDLSTQIPVDGSSLVYNSAAGVWVPGASVVDLSTTTLDDISDVTYGGAPGTGQALLWSGSAWVPGDISVANALDDLTDVSYSGGLLEIAGLDEIRFSSGGEAPSYIGLKVPSNVTVNQTYVLPALDGSAGQALSTDGSGGLSWVTPGADLSISSIDELQDVDTTANAPLTGQGLVWNGSVWAPGDVSDVDLGTSSVDDLQDVDTTTSAPVLNQALVWNGSAWVPGDVNVDEASPAIVWNVTNIGVFAYGFTGSGFSTQTGNPTLYVVRGQKYTFNKTVTGHPFELRDSSNAQYTGGVVESQPLGFGELNWTVPMDAPSTLSYQCTLHPVMNGTIHVLDQSVDLATSNIEEFANVSAVAPTAGQALVWDGAQWVPGTVASGGGVNGSAISQAVTETQTSDANGEITLADLGTSGTLVDIESDVAAWVSIYSSAAARTTDSSRSLSTDPAQGSGVLAEFVLPAATTVLTTPSTNYFNSEALVSESIYVLVRDASTGAALSGAAVTVRAFAISGFTAVSGGTFGSG